MPQGQDRRAPPGPSIPNAPCAHLVLGTNHNTIAGHRTGAQPWIPDHNAHPVFTRHLRIGGASDANTNANIIVHEHAWEKAGGVLEPPELHKLFFIYFPDFWDIFDVFFFFCKTNKLLLNT